MDGSRLRTAALILAALLIGLGVGLATGLFEDDDPSQDDSAPLADEAPDPKGTAGGEGEGAGDPDLPRSEEDPQGAEPGPSGPPPESEDEVAAADAARAYVEAIDERNGQDLCGAFEASRPQRLLDLPVSRGSCAASFEASFGFRGSDGEPVWATSQMTQAVSAQIDGDSARVVATVFTKYSDIREPTLEDDIVYLTRSGERWLVAKPSSTLYRAIGIAEVPLEALQPPG
jgi:hypothetical protein